MFGSTMAGERLSHWEVNNSLFRYVEDVEREEERGRNRFTEASTLSHTLPVKTDDQNTAKII